MMRTWSLEETLIRAQSAVAVAMQGVWDVFTHRPAYANDHPIPGCPSPSDCRGFGCAGDCSEAVEAPGFEDAEPVAEREESDEVWEPAEVQADIRAFGIASVMEWMQRRRRTDVVVQCGHCLETVGDLKAFAVHMLTCDLEPASPKLSSAVSAAMGTSGEAVSDLPPSPASPRSDPSRGNRLASVRGEGGAPDSGIQPSPGAPQPELDWHGWAIPAITECLAEHYIERPTGLCRCGFGDTADLGDWREHVADLIASRLACDPARAIAALHNHTPK